MEFKVLKFRLHAQKPSKAVLSLTIYGHLGFSTPSVPHHPNIPGQKLWAEGRQAGWRETDPVSGTIVDRFLEY